jgi:hypothetical protein
MADPVAASDTAVSNTDLAYLYSETSAGAYRKIDEDRIAHSANMTVADKGKIFYVDENGEIDPLAIGANGSIIRVASGLPAYLSPGNEGDVLTINSSTTPVYARPVYDLVETKTFSGASTVDFVSGFGTGYDEYVFQFIDVTTSANGVEFRCKVSNDAGGSWLTNWSSSGLRVGPSTTTPEHFGSGAVSYGDIFTESSNAAGAGFFGKASFIAATASAAMVGQGLHTAGDGFTHVMFSGKAGTTTRMNGVRFYTGDFSLDNTNGTISGTIRMYRVRNTQG